MIYLIPENQPSQAEVYHPKWNNYRSNNTVAEDDRKNKHITRKSSSIIKVSRSPSFLQFSLSFTYILPF